MSDSVKKTLEEMLALAIAKKSEIMLGESLVELKSQSGITMKFNRANLHELNAWIAELEEKIAGTWKPHGSIGMVLGC